MATLSLSSSEDYKAYSYRALSPLLVNPVIEEYNEEVISIAAVAMGMWRLLWAYAGCLCASFMHGAA